ncbi:hypothetical protein [Jatrophihabitans sp.]|uniref:hypothetical protein n=1 Tax=Jatrophihabitans sp. TaxID=1932789 RepID=UPI0030C70342|nr:hypothetical protein [Jatrophihabitans sp.]
MTQAPNHESLEAALGEIPIKQLLHLPRWLGPLTICFMAGLLPWIVYLAMTLPARSRADHYDIAWVGFDCAMWLVIGMLGFCAFTGRAATGPFAAVAATMLCLDAWFDVTTSQGQSQFVFAIVLAGAAEIPLAILCGWVAVNAELVRARAYRRLRSRWEQAVELARQADERAIAAVRAAITTLALPPQP